MSDAASPLAPAESVAPGVRALDAMVEEHVKLRDAVAASQLRTSDAVLEGEVGEDLVAELRSIYAVIRKCFVDADMRLDALSKRVAAGEASSAETIAGFRVVVDELVVQSATHRERVLGLRDRVDKNEEHVDALAIQAGGAAAIADLAANKLTAVPATAHDDSTKGRAFDLGDRVANRVTPQQLFIIALTIVAAVFMGFVLWALLQARGINITAPVVPTVAPGGAPVIIEPVRQIPGRVPGVP